MNSPPQMPLPDSASILPTISPAEQIRIELLYHYCRLQLPRIELSFELFSTHLKRTFAIYYPKAVQPFTCSQYLDGLYPLDWLVCIACLQGSEPGWEYLFLARTGRTDCLLVDALRARAVRLYPRDEERQETAVNEFWSNLIVPESEGTLPVLARYDGQRPLAPWLIRVFQNWHLSKLRQQSGVVPLPDDEIAMPLPTPPKEESRWHEAFISAAHEWLTDLPESELLLLGLRWRYKMSQREVANLLGVHEGTISRQTDKLRDKAIDRLGNRLIAEGWMGEDLEQFILTELGSVLTDDPRLSAAPLSSLLEKRGKKLPD